MLRKRQGSVSDLSYLISHNQSQPTRTGVIASFSDLAALEKGFENVAALLPIFEPHEFRQRYGSTESPNVMNLALRIFDKADDISEDTWAERALKFVKDHNATLMKHGCLMYFTLRCTDRSWAEEQAIRNIEPALAFRLKLSRLSNYKLRPVFVETKQIHMYQVSPYFKDLLPLTDKWSKVSRRGSKARRAREYVLTVFDEFIPTMPDEKPAEVANAIQSIQAD
ncbi:acetyl-CoA carboxylase [Boletus reticuloceps]|uniref:Acetyl-CoA carboxylase n=1 Tax=Boletus reticuloceps TaxID=495285 RepID=A0A8I2YST7_9AGAM|nr:acetyl-CoA carboxylase [Boletus reticuloceps]